MSSILVSHIGIAVADLEDAIGHYAAITGCREPMIEELMDQKVKVAIFTATGKQGDFPGGRIELVAPLSSDSPVASFLAQRGEGLHHICIYVDNLERKLAELKKAGIKLIDRVPRIGAEGKKIAFIHPSDMNGVLIELEER